MKLRKTIAVGYLALLSKEGVDFIVDCINNGQRVIILYYLPIYNKNENIIGSIFKDIKKRIVIKKDIKLLLDYYIERGYTYEDMIKKVKDKYDIDFVVSCSSFLEKAADKHHLLHFNLENKDEYDDAESLIQ